MHPSAKLESLEMNKTAPVVSMTDLNSNCESTPLVNEGGLSTPQMWSTEPKKLAPSRIWGMTMDVYDGLLCAIPAILIVKAVLCIKAHRMERDHEGASVDLVSPLTIFLVNLNLQVSTSINS